MYHNKGLVIIVLVFGFGLLVVSEPTFFNNLDTSSEELDFARVPPYAEAFRRRCPLCDSSVYSYCSDKLFHDSCCCHNPNNPYDRIPYQCQYADCSFLHSNSCQEHKLITACCCIRHTGNTPNSNVNNFFV